MNISPHSSNTLPPEPQRAPDPRSVNDLLIIKKIDNIIPGTYRVVLDNLSDNRGVEIPKWDESFLELLSPELKAALMKTKNESSQPKPIIVEEVDPNAETDEDE